MHFRKKSLKVQVPAHLFLKNTAMMKDCDFGISNLMIRKRKITDHCDVFSKKKFRSTCCPNMSGETCFTHKKLPNEQSDKITKWQEILKQQYAFSASLKLRENGDNSELKKVLSIMINSWKATLGNIRPLHINSFVSNRQKTLRAHIENSLKFRGFCVLDKFYGNEEALKMSSEFDQLRMRNKFKSGNISLSNSVPNNETCWVSGNESGCDTIREFMNFCDTVIGHGRSIEGKQLTMATSPMLSYYNGTGSRPPMHIDNNRKDGRFLTCTYYLNQNWDSKKHGGNVKLLARTCGKQAIIEPLLDRVVFMYSNHRNPHQVLPAYRERKSITMWYYDHHDRMMALEGMKKRISESSD